LGVRVPPEEPDSLATFSYQTGSALLKRLSTEKFEGLSL